MRYALVLTAAALFAPSVLAASDPPITFQAQPLDRLLGDLRTAADFVGGEKAVKALNTAMRDHLGEKGFEGLDVTKPIVGYVLLAPKLDDITAVIAFPVTGEKEFLSFCERWNNGDKPKDLGKGLYEVPPLAPQLKARMRFAEGYAYIAAGKNPEPALETKALVAPDKLHDPAENAAFAGKLHFDRLTPEVKAALITVLQDAKKELLEKLELNAPDQAALKPVFAELEKLARRYLLLLGGADNLALRLSLDPATGDVITEATLTPKPNTELAKQIAARKPAENRFAGLITPDTVAAVHYTAPLFAEEVRNAFAAFSEHQQKEAVENLPEAAKATVEELFKGQARTTKAGEGDMVVVVRGPDKDGHFNAVAAMSFEDPSALEKAFKKFMETDGPPEMFGTFKWDVDKVGTVNIHTFKINSDLIPPAVKIFGDDCTLAFAFAPKGIFVAIGPDSIATLKDAMKAKPAVAPAFDALVNPAKLAKLVETGGGNPLAIEKALGKENKLLSATSLRLTSGKDLSIRFAINLRLLPRALFMSTKPEAD
jgi:hypothetical protein